MRKQKILSAVLAGLIMLSLAGCGNDAQQTNSDTPSQTVSEDVPSDDNTSANIPAEEPATVDVLETTTEKETPVSQSEASRADSKQNSVRPSDAEKQDIQGNQSSPPQSTESSSKPTVAVTEKTQPSSKPQKPTAPPATQPPKATEPAKPSKPAETKPAEPANPSFDISYWVSYAKNYAQSVGLRLDKYATACGDNPISANAQSVYLERDIQSRLNRYAKDEDITEVWIWAEKVSDNSYEIYIGYA